MQPRRASKMHAVRAHFALHVCILLDEHDTRIARVTYVEVYHDVTTILQVLPPAESRRQNNAWLCRTLLSRANCTYVEKRSRQVFILASKARKVGYYVLVCHLDMIL